jgi:hypothetical protein
VIVERDLGSGSERGNGRRHPSVLISPLEGTERWPADMEMCEIKDEGGSRIVVNMEVLKQVILFDGIIVI